MHGKYKCSVKTDLGSHEFEQDLIVVSEPNCKLDDWRINSEPSNCRESFRFDCRNMFPKPVPSCGLWNGKLDKFIRSVSVDISKEEHLGNRQLEIFANLSQASKQIRSHQSNRPQTYRVSYIDRFELNKSLATQANPNDQQQSSQNNIFTYAKDYSRKIEANQASQHHNESNQKAPAPMPNTDLLQYAGHLIFKCDITIPDTSWKLSISHRMFDFNDGCNMDPLDTIAKIRQNYSQSVTMRMQKAGYLADRQVDDIEMMSAELSYELLPAQNYRQSRQVVGSTFEANNKLDLNCWQKPRFGTLARLSCANKSGPEKYKFLGASLLECRPNGWVLLAESIQLEKSFVSKGLTGNSNLGMTNRNRGDKISRFKNPEDSLNGFNYNSFNGNDNENDDLDSTEAQNPQRIDKSNIPVITTTTDPIDIDLTQEIDVSQPIDDLIAYKHTLGSFQVSQLLPTCISTRRQPISKDILNNKISFKDSHILESSLQVSKQQNRLAGRKNLLTSNSASGTNFTANFSLRFTLITTLIINFVIYLLADSTLIITSRNL